MAILSRFPLRAAEAAALGPRPGRFLRRLALAARIEPGGSGLVAVTTHLALRRRRNALQLGALEAFVGDMAGAETALVGGDLNADESRPEIRPLLRRWRDLYRLAHPEGDAATFEWRGPLGVPVLRRRLDYLLLRPGATPWRCVAIRRTDAPGGGHSDHRALLARLEPGAGGDGRDGPPAPPEAPAPPGAGKRTPRRARQRPAPVRGAQPPADPPPGCAVRGRSALPEHPRRGGLVEGPSTRTPRGASRAAG